MGSPTNSGVDGVALYGAIVATGALIVAGCALIWQIFTWRASHSISLRMETGGYPEGDPEEENYIQVLDVTVVNRTHFPIRVTGASARPEKVFNSEGPLQWEKMTELPTVVPAGDAVEIFFDWQRLDYFLGKNRRLRVSVYLSTGVITKYFSDEVSVWRRPWQWLRRRIRDARRGLQARSR